MPIDSAGIIAKHSGEVRQTPTAFLIGSRGRIVERYVGALDFSTLQRLIESLVMAEPA